MPSLTLNIRPNTTMHKRIIDAINARHKVSETKMKEMHQRWRKSEERFVAFLPERDIDAERRNARDNSGELEYRTIMLPYSYAQMMSAHTYWTTVFLGRSPIMQFSGRHGEGEQQTQAMEALIDYQVQVGEMLVPLYIWLLDTPKYGIGIVGQHWVNESSMISEITEEEQNLFLGLVPSNAEPKKIRTTRRVRGYQGNRIYNVRPYNWYPDPRVPLNQFQKGEFCGVYGEVGWNEILRRKDDGFYMNIERLRGGTRRDGSIEEGENRDNQFSTEIPDITTTHLDPFNPDKVRSDRDLRDANFYGLYDYYIELVPSEWGLGSGNSPEKWVFTTDADRKVLIGARPFGAMHNKFPFDIMQLEAEGYSLFTRSMPELLQPIQDTMDWLINSHFYNVRKAVNDQFVADPSRIVMKDVMDPLPGGIIRLKPAAYGTDTRTALTQLNVTDVTRQHINDIETMNQFGQRLSGVNDQIMGQVNVGGRRTATEVRTSTTFGINRLKTLSEYFSAMGFAPMSQKLVQSSQQYFDGDRKFKIVGDLANDSGTRFIDVDPETIMGFFDFVPVDGTLPIDRFAQVNLWRSLMTDAFKIPAVGATYDFARIFSWVGRLAGLKNIDQFKVQVVPDQQLVADAQAGNVVGLRDGNGGTGSNEPGQVGGVGPTA